MIAIVDYGLGNVLAFANVYKGLNIPVTVARSAAELEPATKVILPGVGAFDHAMELLDASGMRVTLDRKALEERVPVLGICVGMQILAASSDEGRLTGLGWIDGRVRKFSLDGLTQKTRLPHMGWNDVKPRRAAALFRELENEARFYFLHSYYLNAGARKTFSQPRNTGEISAAPCPRETFTACSFIPKKAITSARNC